MITQVTYKTGSHSQTLQYQNYLTPGPHEPPKGGEGASKYIYHQMTKPQFKDDHKWQLMQATGQPLLFGTKPMHHA